MDPPAIDTAVTPSGKSLLTGLKMLVAWTGSWVDSSLSIGMLVGPVVEDEADERGRGVESAIRSVEYMDLQDKLRPSRAWSVKLTLTT
jgi:hypothetical protein